MFGRFTLAALLCGNEGLVRLVQCIGLRVYGRLLLGGCRRLCSGKCGFQGIHIRLRYPRFGRADVFAIGRNRNLLLCLFHGGDDGFQLVIVDGRRSGVLAAVAVLDCAAGLLCDEDAAGWLVVVCCWVGAGTSLRSTASVSGTVQSTPSRVGNSTQLLNT